MSEIYFRGLNAGAFAVRGGDIRIKTGGMQLYALFPARRQTIDEKAVNLPDAKKMRYLSHFCLFIIAGFMGENRAAHPRNYRFKQLNDLKENKKIIVKAISFYKRDMHHKK